MESSAIDKRNSRLVKAATFVMSASLFGPYIGAGLRTDQVVLYATAVLLVFVAPWTWLAWRPTAAATNVTGLWLLYALVALLGALGPTIASTYPPGSLLAGIDNLLLPLAIMTSIWLLVAPALRTTALELAGKTLAWFTAANGVLALIGTRVDLSAYLRPFWGTIGADGLTVNERAAQLGRISGIFNQPAEAGLMYGVAGIAALYAYRDRPRMLYLVLAPIFLGGALCVSKAFLLGAAPIILWQAWRAARNKFVLVLVAATAVVSLGQSSLLANWSGATYLQRLIHPSDQAGYLSYYTAGRVGTGSSLTGVTSEVVGRSPWTGFGARGLLTAYDNGWVEALVLAGLVGAVCYTGVIVALFFVPRGLQGHQRRMAWGLGLLAAVASVGLPALTANRSGAALWLLLAMLMVRQPSRADGEERPLAGERASGAVLGPNAPGRRTASR